MVRPPAWLITAENKSSVFTAKFNQFWIQGTGTALPLPLFLEWSLVHLKPGSAGTLPSNSWADLGVNPCQGDFLRSGLKVATPVGIRPYFGC